MNGDLSSHHRIRSSHQLSNNAGFQWGQKTSYLYLVVTVFVVGCFVAQPRVLLSSLSWRGSAVRLPAGELVQVHVVFRHGARTPLHDTYYNDVAWSECLTDYQGVELRVVDVKGGPSPPKYIDENATALKGGCKEGQLTSAGYQMALDLGRELRGQYMLKHVLLPDKFVDGHLSLWTTRFTRTVQTLKGVLTGLYPHDWETANFTASSVMEEEEIMYGKEANCPALGDQIHLLMNFINETLANSTDLAADAARVSAHLKLPTAPQVAWTYLFDVLAALRAVRRPPLDLDTETWDIINRAASLIENLRLAPCDPDMRVPNVSCHQMVGRGVGRLIDTIASRLMAVTDICDPHQSSSCPPKMYLYSGHDSTITPLLAGFGVKNVLWPPYASHVVVELWKRPGVRTAGHEGREVRLLYRFEPMDLVGSREGGFLSLADFITLIQPVRLNESQYHRSCAVAPETPSPVQDPQQARRQLERTIKVV